jgi:hypothetical protein
MAVDHIGPRDELKQSGRHLGALASIRQQYRKLVAADTGDRLNTPSPVAMPVLSLTAWKRSRSSASNAGSAPPGRASTSARLSTRCSDAREHNPVSRSHSSDAGARDARTLAWFNDPPGQSAWDRQQHLG